jgi:hypothetical protein
MANSRVGEAEKQGRNSGSEFASLLSFRVRRLPDEGPLNCKLRYASDGSAQPDVNAQCFA